MHSDNVACNNAVARHKEKQTSHLHPGQLFFPRDAPGWIRTHDTLLSRRALYQLSYQGNSAGRGSNLQHNTTHLKHCATAQYTLTQYTQRGRRLNQTCAVMVIVIQHVSLPAVTEVARVLGTCRYHILADMFTVPIVQ